MLWQDDNEAQADDADSDEDQEDGE